MRNIVVARSHVVDAVRLIVFGLLLEGIVPVGLGQGSSVFQDENRWEEPIDPRTEPAFQSDARLRDVFFLDATLGWACGDRGTIWSTQNGNGSVFDFPEELC